MTYVVDPTKSPKELDAHYVQSGDAVHLLGIFEVDGDTLRICATVTIGSDPAERPKDFKTRDRDGSELFTLSRAK